LKYCVKKNLATLFQTSCRHLGLAVDLESSITPERLLKMRIFKTGRGLAICRTSLEFFKKWGRWGQGCQMVCVFKPKTLFWVNFEGLVMEDVGIPI
jgi:hypothetical protein